MLGDGSVLPHVGFDCHHQLSNNSKKTTHNCPIVTRRPQFNHEDGRSIISLGATLISDHWQYIAIAFEFDFNRVRLVLCILWRNRWSDVDFILLSDLFVLGTIEPSFTVKKYIGFSHLHSGLTSWPIFGPDNMATSSWHIKLRLPSASTCKIVSKKHHSAGRSSNLSKERWQVFKKPRTATRKTKRKCLFILYVFVSLYILWLLNSFHIIRSSIAFIVSH